MLRSFAGFLVLFFLESSALAGIEELTGVASIDGKVTYIEKHKVEYSPEGKLLRAETSYESADGKPLAHLKSDFTTSLTVPDHIVEDFRSGGVEGLRRENGKLTLFDKEKDKAERTRIIEEKDAENRILVGCQGLNYYVLGHLDEPKAFSALPLRFLIPGKLDYYDFEMNEVRQDNKDLAEFEITAKNWLLKIFAPKLRVKYDRKSKRLVWYQGLSNIKNDKGENQIVTIDYKYEEKESRREK